MLGGLLRKVILSIVAVGFFPLAGGLLWAGLYGQSVLVRASGEKFSELAKQMSSQIDFILEREVHEAQSLALAQVLQWSISSANDNPPGAPKDPRPFPDSILEHPASRHLQSYQSLKEDEYDVIFATDRYGRVVASTRNLPAIDFSHEPWWQAAYQNGSGQVFMSDLYTHPQTGLLGVELALPIYDQETSRVIGVLRFVVQDLKLEQILKSMRMGETGHAMMINQEGQILICPRLPQTAHHTVRVFQESLDHSGWKIQDNGHDTQPSVVALSPVSFTSKYLLGTQPRFVMVTQDRAELFAPIKRVLWIITGLGLALIGLLILLGTLAGKRLVRPILELQRGADILASGDLTHRLQLRTRDELEALAGRVNHMAESLQQRTSELMAARDYLRNIIEQSAALIITTDPSLGIREFNRSAQDILQYRRDQILLKSLEVLWDDPEEFRQIIPQLTTRGQRIRYETTFARKDGASVPVVLSITQLTDQTGKFSGLVVVGEDITDRKELERARLKAERIMSLHRLSTVLTHDLRSPMVGILKALTLFRETYGKMPEEQVQQLLSDLIRGGDILLGTLNDLLDVYRHSLSALPLRYTDFSLKEAIQDILGLLGVDIQARGVKFEMNLALPDVVISADRRRIQRVLFNLLDNAIKHSPSGGLITLQVSAPKEGKIHILVEDQGPGVPDTEFSRIFDFLYQAPGDSKEVQERSGIGVGLYFSRMTVEAHGGCIQAENRPQGGTRFTIQLPVTHSRNTKNDEFSS